ncbi:MAG: metal-dependent hydrolase [Actinophytocola sp.]|uniref:endonuclease/exonuclease/phosphatase family protein n=1 Tax=Actinophytocola sp. TaxID=1872138 RepID=UPI001329AC27|nr:endonuclease/exonuclease/phosphatase family protein [Actinophytocola sp.]MPZ84728.1 metal-dependent hydrolase [Actinophytocola sp.]
MRRLPLLLAALLTLSLLGTPASAAPAHGPGRDVPLRVMNFNIHTGIGSDTALDLARTAAVIRDSRADVVGLQEVDVHWDARSDFRDQAADLARQLHMWVFFAPIYDLPPLTEGAPRRRYGVAVLSRHPIVSAENHLLTRLSTQDPNPVPAPAPGFAEAVVLVRGVPVHVYATHLDYRADPAVRELQVADTLRILAEDRRGARQVLLGDLNAEPTAPELAPLWTRLSDAWTSAEPGPTYPADMPAKRIDYVTVSSGIEVRDTAVVDTLASDHRPVVADLAVRR